MLIVGEIEFTQDIFRAVTDGKYAICKFKRLEIF